MDDQPSLQLQPTASIAALRPVHMPASPNGAAQPLIHPFTIRFGPFQPSAAGSNPPCQPSSLVGTSQSNDKRKGYVGGKQKKSSISKSIRSSQSSKKDNIQFDAKEEVLTIDDQGNEEVIKGSILPRDAMNYKQGNEATSKVQERLLTSSPSKTQVEIENKVLDELKYEEENPKRPIGFCFNVDRSDVFGVNAVLRKRGHTFPDNNMEVKRVKEELASQKAMFLLMLKAVRNGKITDEFLDVTKATLRMAGDQVPAE
ncbi:hypothetical protein Cgig2_014480 [Carnegiea gigantea]|uniref:Uncharacterized protein n=1 Tax=Carnegiea gigantea TaxID=171969 RepID=A0A9Q1JXI2_9CARY|nr:hypothetical protein Cgig2_014480 [Carnegiea gigantea]